MIKTLLSGWGPAILVMAIIFFASATPTSDLPGFGAWDTITKKGGHMIGYALLAAAYLRALDRNRPSTRLHLLIAACLVLLYAASDEFHQKFVPGRTSSISDVFIDMAGASIGLGIMIWRMRKAGARGQELQS